MTNYQTYAPQAVASTAPSPVNNAGIPLSEPGYTQATPVAYFAALSTTSLALVVPPDTDIRRYRITNLDATNAILFNESGYTPGTVSVANCQNYYQSLAAGLSYDSTEPSADGLQCLAAAATPKVLVQIWYN